MQRVDPVAAIAEETLQGFLKLAFPKEWTPLVARIIESGAEYGDAALAFAPRWTPVPRTERYGRTAEETAFKSMIFRVHDCLHQLWGLPVPRNYTDEVERAHFKRMWMCAEVAVLTLTEFFYCAWLYDTQPHLRAMLEHRNTLAFKRTTRLNGMSKAQTATLLDDIIHKGIVPAWVCENKYGRIFLADYGPMLAQDRVNIDHNWALLQRTKLDLSTLPNQRYSCRLDGLELTLWMIADFEHLLDTDDEVDVALACFNAKRRSASHLPATWNEPPKTTI
jgi:hypothetical protein